MSAADAPTPLSVAVTTAVSSEPTCPAVAVKFTVEDPEETATKGGTTTEELLLARVTTPPCVCGRVAVQVLEEPAMRAEGAHTSDRTPAAVVRLNAAACQDVPSVALIVALWSVVRMPALTAKDRVVDPAGTATVPGALRAALSLVMPTVPPATVESVTVQVPDPSCARVGGVHDNEIRRDGVVRSSGRLREAPLSDAVNVAFPSAVMVPAVTTNDAVVEPGTIWADAGAVNKLLLVDSVTEAAPLLDTVAVQVVLSPVCKTMGEHVSIVMMTVGVKVIEALREDPLSDAVRWPSDRRQ